MADGFLTPEWIAAHNAKVDAFRAEMKPLLDRLTDGQCRAIVDAGLVQGLSMNRIAAVMRDGIGGDWNPDHDVAVGTMLYRTALERLDEYDDDFRPRDERQSVARHDGYEVFYLTKESLFEVVIGSKSERFRASRRPVFGMDVDDAVRAAEIAGKLADGDAESGMPR